MSDKVEKSDAEWRALLTPEQYRVARKKDRARLYRRLLGHQDGGRLCLRLLRRGALPLRCEVRFRHGGGPSFWAPIEGALPKATAASL
jgi:peptide-methionine (R)-S-oxide reductase